MAGIHFDITGDNSNFLRRLHEVENGVKDTSKQIEQSGLGIEELFGRMTRAAAAFGAGFTAKELISNIVQVRGEFQQLEVAFKTMLGSEDKAAALMQQLVKTAATTPFDLQGVANGAKQLLAYGEDVEKVNDDLTRLGNIAAGLSQPLGDIVYLYGTTMTQGRLYTQDLNQFTGRGIPMIRELAKVFGVAENEVKGLVEAGKVGFPEVQKVIMSLTDEGGMFFNLMQEQSKTITGQISNIEDSISTMFNEIGKANEGIVNDALSGVSYLVENYEKVGNILLEIVGTYGVYRTALMVTTALQAVQASGITALTAKEAIHYGWLVLTKKAQDALNLSMLKNPYVLAAAAVTGLAYGIYKLATAESDTEKAIRETNDALEAQKNYYEEVRNKANNLTSTLSNESKSIEERFIAYRQLQRLMPEVFKDMDWETAKRKTNAELIKLETDELLRQQRIGLKTKVVMSQQKVQGLENSIIKTTNAGGYTGALKEDLAAAKKELELYQKAFDDFEKAKDEQEKDKNRPTVFNKKYWEDIKKEAEAARDALDVSEKGSKKWNEYTKQILEAEKQIAKYSDPAKQGSQASKEAAKQLKQEEQLAEELLSLRRKNQQDEINLMAEGTEKKLEQIDFDYQKQLDAIRKQEEEWSKAGNGKLTDKQVREISEAYANAESMRDKDITNVTKEQLKAEQQALNDYLKEYGTFQQQKLAIAQEYSEKIRKAQEESGANSAQVKLLEKQRDVAIQNKETEAIKANIDWVTVFGEFGSMFSDMVKPALDEAKKYIQTDKFKNSDQASQKSLIDAISQMEKSLGGTSGVNFKKLGEDVKAYHTAEQNRINAIEIETAALEKLKKSQDDYAKAQKSGTEEEKQVTANALDIARQNADIASANVKTQTDIANQAQRNVTDTATRLKASMENLLGGLQQISSGGLYNAYSGIIKTVNGFKDVIGKTSESLQEVPIVGWILSIIDVLKDGLSDLVGGLLDAVLNAVSGIISDVLSGDLFVTIGNSLKNGIGNILNAISFGGFNSLFGIGGNKKEVEEAINRLTDRNETLQTAIEDLTDEMKASKGTQSVAAYRDAYKYQKETIDNYKRIAQEQARYSGSHHSWNYYWGGFSQEQIDRLSGKIGRDWNGDIWNLTPEEMKMLRETVDMWETIQNTGKGGYGDRLTDKLNDYIDQAGTLEELTNELYEGLTGMSFDSMYDSFVDNLMDMKYDAKAASEDISEYFMRAMLSNKIGELYSEKLEEWWKKFGASMEDNELTEEERKALQDEYMKYVDEAMKLRDELAAATGYDKISQESYSQSSSSRGFGTEMTHEDAGELSGRFTALQVSNEEIKSQMINVVVGIGSLVSISTEGNATLGNILNQHVITNGYLEDIVKYTKPILELGSKLDKIVDNTKNM